MHYNQQVTLSLFYQASHERRIYSLSKLEKSRRVTVSRPVCLLCAFILILIKRKSSFSYLKDS